MKFSIKPHKRTDKSFGAGNIHIWMNVEYDDVNHMEVDAAITQVKQIMEDHWSEQVHEVLYMK